MAWRRWMLALGLGLLLGACTAQQVASTARGYCRAAPERCVDPDTAPGARTPGL